MAQTCSEMFREKEFCQESSARTVFHVPSGHAIPMPISYFEANETYLPWQGINPLEQQTTQQNVAPVIQNTLPQEMQYQLSRFATHTNGYQQSNLSYFPQGAYSLEEHVTGGYLLQSNHNMLHPAMQYQLNHSISTLEDYYETDPMYISECIPHTLEGLSDHILPTDHDVLPAAVQYQLNRPLPRSVNYHQVNPGGITQHTSYLAGETYPSYVSSFSHIIPSHKTQCQQSNSRPKQYDETTTCHSHQNTSTSRLEMERTSRVQSYQTKKSLLMQHQLTQNKLPSTNIPIPQGIDSLPILKARENKLTECVSQRIQVLNSLVPYLSSNMKNEAMIEVKSLKLLELQKQVRREVCEYMRSSTVLETAKYPSLYRREKVQGLREARIIEELEKQRRLQKQHILHQEHKEYISQVLKHRKSFKEYHFNTAEKIYKLNKAIMVRQSALERELKKEQEKIGKERIKRLMAEDEDGYRKLIDQKKDKRLSFLLSQTDEYIKKLADMVRQHKLGQKKEVTEAQVKKQNKVQTLKNYNTPKCTTDKTIRTGTSLHYSNPNKHSGTTTVGKLTSMTSQNESQYKKDKGLSKPPGDEHDPVVDDQDEKMLTEDIATQEKRNEGDEYDSYYNIAHALKEEVKEQASIMINGKLKEYQIKGLEWLVSLYNNNLNGILADEMGLGKTIQVIALITYLIEKKNVHGPHLIIVPLTTMSNWLLEFERWAPSVSKCAYMGSPNDRRQLATQLKTSKFTVVLTTYEYIIKDKTKLSKLHWMYMIIDEGHRMKNHHCKLTQVLNTYYKTSHRLLLTGTPLQNKLPELWSLLNFLLPNIFKSCETFEQWFNAPFAMTGEKVELNDEEQILIIRRLHKVLCPFLLRRLKKEVEAQLPEKVEYVVKCDMSALQHLMYQHMKTTRALPTDNEVTICRNNRSKTLMNTIMQLRKICNHPFLFSYIEEALAKNSKSQTRNIVGHDLYRASGKFELLDRILPKLQKTGHRILLFCQMTTLMTIMEDYLCFKNIRYLRLDGTTKAEARIQLLNLFNDPNSPYFIFLLSTRAGGIGLNLQAADTVILFDSDWNPHQDLQAQDRAHRIGQQNEVRVLRLITVNSVEERILATAKYKLNIDGKVIQAGMFNQKSTEMQRCEFLQAILSQDEINNEEENEVPDNEAINHMLARNEEEFEIYQQMDHDQEKLDRQCGTNKPRLIQESELPEWMIKDVTKVDKLTKGVNEALKLGRGLRKRKRVDYSDSYDDILWHFVTEIEVPEKGSEHESLREHNKRMKASQKATYPEAIQQMKCIMDSVAKYKNDDNRVVSKAFCKLPTKRELPDYYQHIKEPIDIRKIRTRIRKNYYHSLDDFEKDFMLMCKNAQTYNQEDSTIYKDSLAMQTAFAEAKESLKSNECEEVTDAPDSTDESSTESPTSSFKLKISLGKDASENRVESITNSNDTFPMKSTTKLKETI